MSKKLDEAIEALLAVSQKPGCWAARLDGDADEFVKKISQEEAKGIKINRTAARGILSDVFGVDIGEDSFRKHLFGRCSCGKSS